MNFQVNAGSLSASSALSKCDLLPPGRAAQKAARGSLAQSAASDFITRFEAGAPQPPPIVGTSKPRTTYKKEEAPSDHAHALVEVDLLGTTRCRLGEFNPSIATDVPAEASGYGKPLGSSEAAKVKKPINF